MTNEELTRRLEEQRTALRATAGCWKDKDHPEQTAALPGFTKCGKRTRPANKSDWPEVCPAPPPNSTDRIDQAVFSGERLTMENRPQVGNRDELSAARKPRKISLQDAQEIRDWTTTILHSGLFRRLDQLRAAKLAGSRGRASRSL